MNPKRFPPNASSNRSLSRDLLKWYDHHARELPWRIGPKQSKDSIISNPYHVWLSEVMLQQTTVATVTGYYDNFLTLWPSVNHMAAADEEDVLKAWAGLGYYSRARNLKKCADIVAVDYGGHFPDNAKDLQKLPGIGEYTAAAIAAIAFGRAEPVVDGNIERIISRLNCIDTPLPKSRPVIREFMAALMPVRRPGDFVQAMMDLGATICTPRSPICKNCPIVTHCKATTTDQPSYWPIKTPKKAKPERVGAAFVAIGSDSAILLQKRPDKGLLAGMSEVPTTGWTARVDGDINSDAAPFKADWRTCGTIRHTFTHFHLTLHVFRADISKLPKFNGWWSTNVESEALPIVFRKVIEKAWGTKARTH
jgi:A/G-specific adenine glycosylase